ncbi:MAG: dTDP-4-dehydro-6-deoxyglucose aminotransferase [Moorea sp. SIO2B7]|nr:dTDP-4-dehydro-6-deoxyglucose aminotransferase [Moorena sp. SIO2B7]
MNRKKLLNLAEPIAPFAQTLHVGRPNIGNYELFLSLVQEIFERRWFSNKGQMVAELESRLAEYLGVAHCILVCNGTIGLQIATKALELTGEVIVPAFTFIATVHNLPWMGLKPIFVDIDPNTHTLDPLKIVPLITEKTSAIFGVHLWGNPCNTEVIEEIAQTYGLSVIYDAAHAFGCSHQGKMIGNFGDCEVFSFHATKFFQTFEGGAITTNNEKLAQKIRLMKNFGFSGLDNVIEFGINGKMSEIQAAMGLACFEMLDEILNINLRNYETYRNHLEGMRGIRFLNYGELEKTNYQYIILEIEPEKARLTRDELIQVLHAYNVRARRYFYPGCHKSEPYRTLYPEQINSLPNTDFLCNRVLCLPTGQTISVSDINKICQIIKQALRD